MTMEFISLFEEAGAEAEAQQHEAALAKASAAASGVWPFLSLAKSESEFEHRLALSETRLSTVAAEHGIDMEDLTRQYRTAFTALREQRQEHRGSRQHQAGLHTCALGCGQALSGQDEVNIRHASTGQAGTAHRACFEDGKRHHEAAREARQAGSMVSCSNCGHANPPHTKGAQCSSCGCDSYQPRARGGPRRASWEQHYASIHQALMEGQDPLEWVQEMAPPGPGQPEKPGGHTTEPEPYTYAEVPPGELNQPNLPPQQRRSARDRQPPNPDAAEKPGGHTTDPEPYSYAEVPPSPLQNGRPAITGESSRSAQRGGRPF